MNLCENCGEEITIKDFNNKNEVMLCSPRYFIGEGYSNASWPIPEELDKHLHSLYASLCKKCRLIIEATNLVRIFSDLRSSKEWIKDMKEPL